MIRHSHDSRNSLIDEDDVLSGTIYELTTASGIEVPQDDDEKDIEEDINPFADPKHSDDESDEDEDEWDR